MSMHEIAIIGGGPAGLTAAIYSQRAGKNCIIFEKSITGGNINETHKVENIPGFTSISGSDFAEKLTEQTEACGATIACEEVTNISQLDHVNGNYVVQTTEDTYLVKAVIIATGTEHNVLGLPNESKFIGNGIHFCALCDGQFYKDKDVVVVGGGNSAMTEALYLSKICKTVTIEQNLSDLTGEAILKEKILNTSNININYNSVITEYEISDNKLTGVWHKVYPRDFSTKVSCDGVFLCIGLHPVSIESDLIPTDHKGYIISEHCPQGIFVAGDCSTSTEIKQVVTACASGAEAAVSACKYVDSL